MLTMKIRALHSSSLWSHTFAGTRTGNAVIAGIFNELTKNNIQLYPNPFTNLTAISYQLTARSNVLLSVYDMYGRLVTTLVNNYKEPGRYEVNFNGDGLPYGMYVYRLVAGLYNQTRKFLLMK